MMHVLENSKSKSEILYFSFSFSRRGVSTISFQHIFFYIYTPKHSAMDCLLFSNMLLSLVLCAWICCLT